MNLQETVSLVQALRAAGVKRFKSIEHEIDFEESDEFQVKKLEPLPPTPTNSAIDPIQQKAIDEANSKIKEMVSTMNLTAQQLADKMFPEAEV
jgi:hypothetical protein